MPSGPEQLRLRLTVLQNTLIMIQLRHPSRREPEDVTFALFEKYKEYLLCDDCYGLRSSEDSGSLVPPWSLVLSYEHAIRKHAYKVMATAGYSFGAALVHAYKAGPQDSAALQLAPPPAAVRKSYLDRIAAEEFDAVLLSPPCASFSRATWANFKGPRPVRSYEHPRGLEMLTPVERDRAILGNIFADFSYEVATLVADGAATFLAMEQPEDLGALAPPIYVAVAPASRPSPEGATALTHFPPLKEGASVLEYTLGYERLITEYEKLSSARYPEDLKISTLMSGLPQDIKRYLQLQIEDSTPCNGLHSTLLYVKRACQAHASSGAGSWKGKKGDVGKDKGKKGKGDKGSWHNKGYDQAKGYKGYANFKGNVKGKFGGGKGKERGKKSFGSGFGSPGGKGKGPCFICGRMGHRAAECHLRVRVQQVRRLELAHDVLMEEIFDETEAGEVGEPLWESHVHDLSWYESEEVWDEGWDEYDGFGGYVRMVAEIVEPAEHELLEDVQSECGSSCSLPSTSTLHFSLCDEDEVDSQCELDCGAESDWVLLQQARAEEAELCVRAVAEGHEVILDSGDDVTVVAMHMRNSVAATMKILRTEEAQVRMVVELGESFVNSLKRRGWQLNENGQPAHVNNSSSTTTDPSEMYDPEVLARRTTLVQQSGRRYTVFECGEYWEPKPVMEI
ncbi:unnamed protein product [Symbiodinium sp. KB8]|nr:unnamed protein product [Symbiodinium sp. KB8]